MNSISAHVDKVTEIPTPNRAARRRQQQAQARAERTVRRGQSRMQKAIAAYPKENAA